MIEMGAPIKDGLEAAKNTGRQIVRDAKMSPKTLSIVSRELVPKDTYIRIFNQHFHEQLKKIDRQESNKKRN